MNLAGSLLRGCADRNEYVNTAVIREMRRRVSIIQIAANPGLVLRPGRFEITFPSLNFYERNVRPTPLLRISFTRRVRAANNATGVGLAEAYTLDNQDLRVATRGV
jgi:hypothetical protein